jgi:drug/metabolite transporter (DMT)-like permease
MAPAFDIENSMTFGAILGVLSGLSFAVLQTLNRKYVQIYSGKLITFYQTGVATIVLLPAVSFGRGDFSLNNVLLLAVLGILCTALAHSLFIGGLRTIKVRTASIISGLEPVYGIAVAVLFLYEMPSWREICGGMIILAVVARVSLKQNN